MVLVQFHCPHCSGLFQVDSSHGGSQVLCPTCSGVVTVPVLEDESQEFSDQDNSGSIDDLFGTTARGDVSAEDGPGAPDVYRQHEPIEDLPAIDDLLPPGAAEVESAPADTIFADASSDLLSAPDSLTGAAALTGETLLPPTADGQNVEPLLPTTGQSPNESARRRGAEAPQSTARLEAEDGALLDVIVVAPHGRDDASSKEREHRRARRNLVMLVLGVAVLVAAVLLLRHL